MIAELEPFVKELKKKENIIGFGVYGSYSRGSNIDIETEDISYHSDIDVMIWTKDNANIKELYLLKNKYSSSLEIDISIYNIDIVKYVCGLNKLTMVVFLKLLEKVNWFKQTEELKAFMNECRKELERDDSLHRFYREFSAAGQHYALAKDLMNTIKRNSLLELFDY